MKNNRGTGERNKPEVDLNSISVLSPHNEALYETGKEMLKSSLDIARDFCKSMINISMGAIPIYLGLLKFVLPKNVILPTNRLVLSAIPPFFFLVSAVLFILGYFPQTDYFSLEIIEEIKQAYEKTIKKRKVLINLGVFFFLVGSVLAILSIIINIIN